MHDIVNNIAIEQVLSPQTIQSAALDSGDIDLLGCGTLAVAVAVGNIGDALDGNSRIDLKIEHADDNGSGVPAAYAACADADVQNAAGLDGNGVFVRIDANAKENKRHAIGYCGGKRFVRVTATPVSIETGGPIAMIALKGNAAQKPVSNT